MPRSASAASRLGRWSSFETDFSSPARTSIASAPCAGAVGQPSIPEELGHRVEVPETIQARRGEHHRVELSVRVTERARGGSRHRRGSRPPRGRDAARAAEHDAAATRFRRGRRRGSVVEGQPVARAQRVARVTAFRDGRDHDTPSAPRSGGACRSGPPHPPRPPAERVAQRGRRSPIDGGVDDDDFGRRASAATERAWASARTLPRVPIRSALTAPPSSAARGVLVGTGGAHRAYPPPLTQRRANRASPLRAECAARLRSVVVAEDRPGESPTATTATATPPMMNGSGFFS